MRYRRLRFTSSSNLPSWALTLGRAVRLKVIPRPTQIRESKNILSALQTYGRVVYFQSLRYEPEKPAPNTILAIFAEADSATKLLRDPNFILEMGSWGFRKINPRDPDGAPSVADASGDPGATPSPASKTFGVEVERSEMDFYARLKRQHYFSTFDIDRSSIMFHDLQKRIPIDAMADCQVKKGEAPMRKRAAIAEAEKQERRGAYRPNVMEMWKRAVEGSET